MSTNCIQCVKRERTGPDLLCDECRASGSSPAPGSAVCEWKYTETLGCQEPATWATPTLMEDGPRMWKLCDTHRRLVQEALDGKFMHLSGNRNPQWVSLRQNDQAHT
jgi:hypothetical protein